MRFDLNPTQIASYGTALAVARLTGGTVVEPAYEWWKTTYPVLHVLMGNGLIINAGLAADLFRKYGVQTGSAAWEVILRDTAVSQFVPPATEGGPTPVRSEPPRAPTQTVVTPAQPVRPTAPQKPPAPEPPLVRYFLPGAVAPIGGALGPPGWIAIAVGSIIAGLFSIFGGGGVNKETKRALEGLRDSQIKMGDSLMRFTWGGFFGFGWLLRAFHNVWVRIIIPMLDKVGKFVRWADRLFDRVIRPYLKIIKKIREHVLRIYEAYVRPVLDAIQKVRQVLAVFRIAGFKWAIALDDALAKVQGKIAQAVALVFAQLSELARWQNVLLTWRLILQQPIFVNSMHAYAQIAAMQFWNAHLGKPASGGGAGSTPQVRRRSMSEAAAGLRAYAATGASEYAADYAARHARIRAGVL